MPSAPYLLSVPQAARVALKHVLCIDASLHPQELLSHSIDRPERQQLKEALEAMQVCAAHTTFARRLFSCAVRDETR